MLYFDTPFSVLARPRERSLAMFLAASFFSATHRTRRPVNAFPTIDGFVLFLQLDGADEKMRPQKRSLRKEVNIKHFEYIIKKRVV